MATDPQHLPAVGTVLAVPARAGSWGALQIVGRVGDALDVIALGWWSDHRPALAQLRRSRPLRLTHHAHDGADARGYVEGPPPVEFATLGILPVKVKDPPETASHLSWDWLVGQADREAAWQRVPARVRRAYKRCHREGPAQWRVSVGSMAHCSHRVDPGAPFDWTQLDALGCLTELDVHGDVPGALAYAATRPLLSTLRLVGHGQSRIDVRALPLRELAVSVPSSGLKLVVGELDTLALLDGGGPLEVGHPRRGAGLRLELRFEAPELPAATSGLPRLDALSATARFIDARRLIGYPQLRELRLSAAGGAATHLDALAKLERLRTFELWECYDFDPATLPALEHLPALATAELAGLRKTSVAGVRARWGALPRLVVRGARSDAWLQANIDNPFVGWVDHHPATVAATAAAAYRRSLARLRKLRARRGARRVEMRKEVEAFTAAFNVLDAKVGLDTADCEEVGEALIRMFAAAQIDIDAAQLDAWFEEARAF